MGLSANCIILPEMTRAGLILIVAANLALGACLADQQALDLTDAGVKARIEANLKSQPDLDLRYVTVDVHQGVATISGLVINWDDEKLIERIVKRTKGVDQGIFNLVTQE